MNFSDEILECISIDCVIFGFQNRSLSVLLVKHLTGTTKGQWALPGGWIKYNESVDDAAHRILTAQTSVSNIFLEQFHTFGDVERVAARRVITVGYYALVNREDFELHPGNTVADAQWFDINEVPEMAYDHNAIFDRGFTFLQHKILHEPVGFNLLPSKFTLLQLQELYEAILGKSLDKPNFRRKFLKMKLLVPCNEKQNDVAHRAASLYRFDKKVYDQLLAKGFSFEV